MYRILLQKNIQTRGFTLVEMMVAIAVFSIVMVVATSALLNVIDANYKAQAIKTAINNVNFALEGISKDMRVGTDFACGDNPSTEPSGDCAGGGMIIKYRSNRTEKSGGKFQYVYYRYIAPTSNTPGKIEQCISVGGISCTINSTFSPITSTDVNIKSMKFYVIGVDYSAGAVPGKTQPRMIITLTGEAGTKEKIKTEFDLQTTVSQRARK